MKQVMYVTAYSIGELEVKVNKQLKDFVYANSVEFGSLITYSDEMLQQKFVQTLIVEE